MSIYANVQTRQRHEPSDRKCTDSAPRLGVLVQSATGDPEGGSLSWWPLTKPHPPESYVFVPGLDRSYGRQKRALVLRRHFELKAKKRAQPLDRGVASSHSANNGDARRVCSTQPQCDPAQAPYPLTTSTAQIPRTRVDDAGQFDPFDTTETFRTRNEQRLIQQYLDIGKLIFDLKLPGRACPQHIYFSEVGGDEAAAAVMKLYAAAHIASRSNVLSRNATQALRAQALLILNERMADLERAVNDGTITAVAGLIATDAEPAFHEDGRDYRHELSVHISGIIRLIMLRGGWKALPGWLEFLAKWQDIHMFGEISVGLDHFQRRHADPTDLQNPGTRYPSPGIPKTRLEEPLRRCVDEFDQVYSSAYSAASFSRRLLLYGTGARRILTIGSLFQPGTMFYTLLSKRCLPGDQVPVAILAMLNLLVAESASDPSRLAARISANTLLTQMLQTGAGSAEAMLLALLGDDVGGVIRVGHAEKFERIFRSLYVYKRLSWHMQLRVKTALMEFLWADSCRVDLSWGPERMRTAIEADLLCNAAQQDANTGVGEEPRQAYGPAK